MGDRMLRHVTTDSRGEQCGEQLNCRRTGDHPTQHLKRKENEFHADSKCPTTKISDRRCEKSWRVNRASECLLSNERKLAAAVRLH
jgi:hypothetical protein